MKVFIFLSLFIPIVLSSKCVISPWRNWGPCLGNCDYAQRVRNRDVLRPSFPERNSVTGEIFIRACLPLYEVETCIPNECDEDSPFVKSLNSTIPIINSSSSNLSTKIILNPKKITNNEKIEKTELMNILVTKSNKRVAGTTLVSWIKNLNRTNCGLANKRCCRVMRSIALCPDGSRPKQLIRYHRQKNETFCRAFHYPYCGAKYESLDLVPLVSEEECIESCFNPAEKVILPSLRII